MAIGCYTDKSRSKVGAVTTFGHVTTCRYEPETLQACDPMKALQRVLS
jgi:hypothetical protein